jgi:hypothetical protein
MHQRLRSHLTYANVMATIAVFLVLGGGSAVALSGTNTVDSGDIIDNQVKGADVRDDSLAGGGLAAADLKPGSVGTSEVANGSIADGDLAPAARGARAYGRVSATGTLSRSKNASVSHNVTGHYCITLAGGIDPTTAVLVVAPDRTDSSTSTATDTFPIVEWNSLGAVGCMPPELEVATLRYNGDDVDDNDGAGNTTGDALAEADEPFTFVVP